MINRSEAYRNVDIAILHEDRQFAMLEEEWEELYRHSPAATPFQSWAWLYSWWEYYGGGYELRLVTIRSEDGLLVALLPLMLERRGGLGRLLLVGSGKTDYLDVLVREGWEDRVADPGAQALGNIGSWQVADLQMLHPEAAAWSVFAGRRGPRAAVQQSNCYVIGVRPWDEVLMSLSRKWRKTARRMLRRMEADGLRRGIAGEREAEKAGRTAGRPAPHGMGGPGHRPGEPDAHLRGPHSYHGPQDDLHRARRDLRVQAGRYYGRLQLPDLRPEFRRGLLDRSQQGSPEEVPV
jgi:CelD/BcsL family acetyltransferase involved in cellulose biosynthesis